MIMNVITIQIQSIIFNNNKGSLIKAIEGLENAVRFCKKNEKEIKIDLKYGDASPYPVLTESDVNYINKKVGNNINFEYRIFGFNSGTAKGHNLLCKECKSDYVMVMNPDVILSPNCLQELLNPFTENDIGIVEARQTPLEHAKGYNRETGETDWASTACVLFRKAVFDEVHGFDDETFFMYCDDLDFSWRVRMAGYRVIYKPNAVVYHSKKLSLDAKWLPSKAEIYYSAEAALMLAYKWSNFSRVDQILQQFNTIGNDEEKRAACNFIHRKKLKQLPIPVDKEHRIAKFIGDDYCEMRFKMN